MLKFKSISMTAIAAAVTASLSFTAFAAEAKPQAEAVKAKSADCGLTAVLNTDSVRQFTADLKRGGQGKQTVTAEDGLIITFQQAVYEPEDGSDVQISIVPSNRR